MEHSGERCENIRNGAFDESGGGNGGQVKSFADLIKAECSSSSGFSVSEEATIAPTEEHAQRSSSEASSSSPNSLSWTMQQNSDPPDCSSDNGGAEDSDEERSHFHEDEKLEKHGGSLTSVSGALPVPFIQLLSLLHFRLGFVIKRSF